MSLDTLPKFKRIWHPLNFNPNEIYTNSRLTRTKLSSTYCNLRLNERNPYTEKKIAFTRSQLETFAHFASNLKEIGVHSSQISIMFTTASQKEKGACPDPPQKNLAHF